MLPNYVHVAEEVGASSLLSVCVVCLLCAVAMQRAHWQAHDGAIASVDIIPARAARLVAQPSSSNNTDAPSSNGPSSSSQVFILTGSRDCNVAVWTLDGGLVGVLGDHSWDLDDQTTWQDQQGQHSGHPSSLKRGRQMILRWAAWPGNH